MGILEFLRRSFGTTTPIDAPAYDRQAAADRAVDGTDPRLRLVPGYVKKLVPGIDAAAVHIRGVVLALPGPVPADPEGWSSDPAVRAFFAGVSDIQWAASKSAELQAFFKDNPGATEAYGLLGGQWAERTVLGSALDGDRVIADVPRRTLGFPEKRVIAIAGDELAARRALAWRIYDFLIIQALKRLSEIKSRKEALEQERGMLKARLQFLARGQAGLQGLTGNGAGADAAEIECSLAENERALSEIPSGPQTLGRHLSEVRKVLAGAAELVRLDTVDVRLDRVNNIIEGGDAGQGPVADLRFTRVALPNRPMVGVMIARFRREDMLSKESVLDLAGRRLL